MHGEHRGTVEVEAVGVGAAPLPGEHLPGPADGAEGRGQVRRVTVGLSGRVDYVELGVVAEAWGDGGAVTWAW
ncbi:hypothetical protein F8568_001770 [Actinomadura sp. LD22]|uniref:Uncharacterized protein n=1 Tax=Actinomadura physcomitrii TaxID=2650748 RepID=A0A6I4M482_9ACTN|nr:hypothetical protein [Actinomadura physcomitrii]MVZ99134.1 hypothetical protein [Actinomadura physcomitrii]